MSWRCRAFALVSLQVDNYAADKTFHLRLVPHYFLFYARPPSSFFLLIPILSPAIVAIAERLTG
eukprot:762723-Hanusia_phi.AAC.12